MISLRNVLPVALLASSAIFPSVTLAQEQQQQAFQLACDSTDASNPPSTPLDDWINSLLQVLHDNAKFAFEQVVIGFAGTEDGYDVLEAMWEHTANGGAGENWSLMVPSDDAFTKSGLASPYASLDAATLYSLFTYHAVPLSLSSAINASSSHTLLETLFPLPNGDGQVMIAERGQPDGLKVVSPVEAKVKTDSLDEGSSSGTLSGLELFEVDTIVTVPATLPTILANLATSTSTSAKKSGLALYAAALNNTKTLNTLTGFGSGGSKGLTIFAPVDEAFDGSMTSGDVAAWTKVLAGHYSPTQTLYSNEFANTGAKVFMSNGNAITFTTNSSGTFAVSSDGYSSAKILRSDVLLQGGGVLHVVDTLLSAAALQTAGPGGKNGTGPAGGVGFNLNGGAAQTQAGAMVAAFALAVGFFGLI